MGPYRYAVEGMVPYFNDEEVRQEYWSGVGWDKLGDGCIGSAWDGVIWVGTS